MKRIRKERLAHEVISMAMDRQRFKSKLEEYVSGAMGEYYKLRLARANKASKYTDHWQREVDGLLRKIRDLMLYPIRGFKDRRKIVEAVLNDVVKMHYSYERITRAIIKKDYQWNKLKVELPEETLTAFITLIRSAVEQGLQMTI